MFHAEATGDVDDQVARSVSRRAVLRGFGGLSLIAVGAAAFRPAVAAAAPTISNALLEISVSEPPVVEAKADGFVFENPFTQKADIKVTATINFTAADLRAMRNGKKYRLLCEVWENDNDNQAPEPGIDQFVFDFPRKVYPKSETSLPSRSEPVTFRTTVDRSTLDLDTPNPNGDEIVALLVLTTPSGQQVTQATNLVKLCPCQP